MAHAQGEQRRTIDGLAFRMSPLEAVDGSRLWFRLAKCLGPVYLTITDSKGQGPAAIMSKALQILGQDPAGDQLFEDLRAAFSASTVVLNGDEPAQLAACFNVLFQQRYGTLAEFMLWGMELNFQDFLDKIQTLMKDTEDTEEGTGSS